MSTKYPGGFITKSPVAPTTTAASGVWTLDQQQQYQKAGTWPSPPIFIEDLFSTYLYTGNGSTQTITNGIDLPTNGGLVIAKRRDTTSVWDQWCWHDSTMPNSYYLGSPYTYGRQAGGANRNIVSFSSSGFLVGTADNMDVNESGGTYASWTFREQPKFFDIVTYTGTGSARTVAHNLGSAPGCIIVKRTDTTGSWAVYHQARGQNFYLFLNTTAAEAASATYWNNTAPTSTEFTVGTNTNVNASGGTYVAYLFAHNAGGFPASGSGSTNGISCGSYTGSLNTPQQITLGYEPQWVLLKKSDAIDDWYLFDNMRGMALTSGGNAILRPNTSGAEAASSNWVLPNATGFVAGSSATDSNTYIYIAIRRGPMKVPTSGTSVFAPVVSASAVGTATTTNFPVDLQIFTATGVTDNKSVVDRLRGVNTSTTLSSLPRLNTVNTDAEASSTLYSNNWGSTGFGIPGANASVSSVYWNFRRAPSFFDEVCYTGNGVADRNIDHNLAALPQLIIVKPRNLGTQDWTVMYFSSASSRINGVLNGAFTFNGPYTNWTVTNSTFVVNSANNMNGSGYTYVAYLFATCPGVSKVGSYTGTGALLTVDCGFTSGARFVLIKRTDSTGDWYTYDSARGITSGNDPYLLLNSTAAEVTGTNYVDTDTTGFQVTAAAPAGLNASGGTYIFLAIA